MERISKAEPFVSPCLLFTRSSCTYWYCLRPWFVIVLPPSGGEGGKTNLENGLKWGHSFLINQDFQTGKKFWIYVCIYTNDAFKIITVVIIFSDCNHDRSVPNVGVALRQIASSISVPTSNKSPISLLYCNCIQMIWWSDDDADDFNALGA